jgi:hypothetical protein
VTWPTLAEISQAIAPTQSHLPSSAAGQKALKSGMQTTLVDEREHEPLATPVPKATNPRDATRIASTHSVSRKLFEQQHRRKLRRESAMKQRLYLTPSPVQQINDLPGEDTERSKLQKLETIDTLSPLNHEQSLSASQPTTSRAEERRNSSVPGQSQHEAKQPDNSLPEVLSAPSGGKKAVSTASKARPMTLTPIKRPTSNVIVQSV